MSKGSHHKSLGFSAKRLSMTHFPQLVMNLLCLYFKMVVDIYFLSSSSVFSQGLIWIKDVVCLDNVKC